MQEHDAHVLLAPRLDRSLIVAETYQTAAVDGAEGIRGGISVNGVVDGGWNGCYVGGGQNPSFLVLWKLKRKSCGVWRN